MDETKIDYVREFAKERGWDDARLLQALIDWLDGAGLTGEFLDDAD